MKILYFDCSMGAAGDMLAAALLELADRPESVLAELNAMGLPGVTFSREDSVKCGVRGSRFVVTVQGEEETEHMHEHAHEHAHGALHDIRCIVAGLKLPEEVRRNVFAIFDRLALAESHVHGVPVTQIHFHELGTMDAVADISAVCLLLHHIAPEEIVVSPVHVGSGQVRCAHGLLPVPAPATAELLRDVPIYGGAVQGELCTPTGAALLTHFASRFGSMPVMRPTAIGYGMGKKDFEAANCVRALLGESGAEKAADASVCELSCNLDDMTPEAIAFAAERLLAAGALDVYTIPVGMKKSRPGVLLCVICQSEQKDSLVRLIFRHTTTLGVRESDCRRYTLSREIQCVPTPFGDVRKKRASGYGVAREKYEYEDLARIARETDESLPEIVRQLDAQKESCT
ncbi:MAG: nickel pincer cofactor biosynthesis protein LarC [Oscillospiraceae bacterium]